MLPDSSLQLTLDATHARLGAALGLLVAAHCALAAADQRWMRSAPAPRARGRRLAWLPVALAATGAADDLRQQQSGTAKQASPLCCFAVLAGLLLFLLIAGVLARAWAQLFRLDIAAGPDAGGSASHANSFVVLPLVLALARAAGMGDRRRGGGPSVVGGN